MASFDWDLLQRQLATAGNNELAQLLGMDDISPMGDAMEIAIQGSHCNLEPSLPPPSHTPLPASDAEPQLSPNQPLQDPMLAFSTSSNASSHLGHQLPALQQQTGHLQQSQSSFFSKSAPPLPTASSQDHEPTLDDRFLASRQSSYEASQWQGMPDQQDFAFTPLMSPAVTPLAQHFNLDSTLAVSSAYFSPLTSPALRAQSDYISSNSDLGMRTHDSPVDMELEAPATTPLTTAQDWLRRTRKNSAVKARTKASVKSSPISKPQRRKTGPSPAIMSQLLSETDEQFLPSGEAILLPMPAATNGASDGNASLSPESMLHMPPPPVPMRRRSTSRSPYLGPQNEEAHQMVAAAAHPATPASLMRLSAPPSVSPSSDKGRGPASKRLDALELPASATEKGLGLADASHIAKSLTLERSRSGMAAPRPSPSRRKGTPAEGSALERTQQQLGLSGPSRARAASQPSNRKTGKRTPSSVQASPALLPKISPVIKPNLPGARGATAEESASQLLMTKSNYQNILEGNLLPGVSYPSELSTNLTSKRTSHKIAEQGRRNRINSALQAMANMLPDPAKMEAGDEREKQEKRQTNTPGSKASVVELAIQHMRTLQQENEALKAEVQELKSKLAGTKPRPQQGDEPMEGGYGAGSREEQEEEEENEEEEE